jgi:lysyl-tRNA synthetase class 2
MFIDLFGDENKTQILASLSTYQGDFNQLHVSLRRGDIIGVEGNPGRSDKGELSVRALKITNLSYCLH